MKQTVLVVDDSRAIRAFVRLALEDAGFAVCEAADGHDALAQVAERLPDLVLLDVDMPGLDGFRTLERLNSLPSAFGMPVIFLTAHSAAEDAVTGLTLGAQDYIRKPCQSAELVARVRRALAQKARHDALRRQLDSATHLSTTDTLTGLPNRRRIEEAMAAVDGPADSRRRMVSVAVVDIDHFKQVNDREGHHVGDLVLRAVALRMQSVVPEDACLGRWGGEEFVCVLPGHDLAAGFRCAEAMRNAVSESAVAIGLSKALDVTVSIGVATGLGGDTDQLLVDADAALYEAKRSGRNRVVSSVGTTALTA